MTLIRSISGIRGIIGNKPGNGLTPVDIVRFTSAYGEWLRRQEKKENYRVVTGRDARISGGMVNRIVSGTLLGMGIDVTDLGMASTPTVEMAVGFDKADGGIIITASHNPAQWNALKLLNNRGEFLSAADGEVLLDIADAGKFDYSEVYGLGKYAEDASFADRHIDAILNLPLVDAESIRKKNFRIAIDCVNSVGSLIVPVLLKALGIENITGVCCEPDGQFPHDPEPLPENLHELSSAVVDGKADVGFAVDPDVDRLAIVSEDGSMFGEEYTLVAVADYVLANTPGNTVSNLSSTRALREITERHGGSYTASAVGEVNVIEEMKRTGAVIGGEGNGGVIYPPLHYGRDALAGIALFLTHLAKSGVKCSVLRKKYPDYRMVKRKITLAADADTGELLDSVKKKFRNYPVTLIDGIRIDFPEGWVHMRKSNTEPVIRIYSESSDSDTARKLADMVIRQVTPGQV